VSLVDFLKKSKNQSLAESIKTIMIEEDGKSCEAVASKLKLQLENIVKHIIKLESR